MQCLHHEILSDEKKEECFRIDIVDSIIQDTDVIPTDKLEAFITNMTNSELDAESLEYINYLDKPFRFKSTPPLESLELKRMSQSSLQLKNHRN